MKKKILLVDESITVQKVVSLTLDKSIYDVHCLKTRSEAMNQVQNDPPDLILLSEQTDANPDVFPKEVESWLRPPHEMPALILITAQEIAEKRGFQAILRKPFSPKNLQNLVAQLTAETKTTPNTATQELSESVQDFEAQRLENAFNSKFNDEADLVSQTLKGVAPVAEAPKQPDPPTPAPAPIPNVLKPAQAPGTQNIWGNTPPPPTPNEPTAQELWGVPKSKMPSASTAPSPSTGLSGADFESKISQLLNEMLPPIVERLVKERLDALLTESKSEPIYSSRR